MCENPQDNSHIDKGQTHIPTFTRRSADGDVAEVRLWGWGSFKEFPKSLLLGELVKRTRDVVENYHGDLYHDVHWLDQYLTGPMTFYWTARSYGTNIGTEPMFGVDGDHEVFHNYVVELVCHGKPDDGEWFVTFTRVPSDEASVKKFNETYTENFATVATQRAIAGAEASRFVTTRWLCDAPALGVGYRVLEEEWNGARNVRTIKRIEIVP